MFPADALDISRFIQAIHGRIVIRFNQFLGPNRLQDLLLNSQPAKQSREEREVVPAVGRDEIHASTRLQDPRCGSDKTLLVHHMFKYEN